MHSLHQAGLPAMTCASRGCGATSVRVRGSAACGPARSPVVEDRTVPTSTHRQAHAWLAAHNERQGLQACLLVLTCAASTAAP